MAIAICQWLRIQGVSSLPSNIWVGTSVENQKCADERIPELLKIPASVRFLSVEPILEGITLESIASYATKPQNCLGLDKINWVIVGGESGKNARPCRVEWLISIVKQCGRAKVPVFVKQLGSNPLGTNCIRLQDKKGGDITEFPDELQARHFPC
jgi:protein gp37